MPSRHRLTGGRHLGKGRHVRIYQDVIMPIHPCSDGRCTDIACENGDDPTCCEPLGGYGTAQSNAQEDPANRDFYRAEDLFAQEKYGNTFANFFGLGAINLLVPSYTQIYSENRDNFNDAADDNHIAVQNISRDLKHARWRRDRAAHIPLREKTYAEVKKYDPLTPRMSMGNDSPLITSIQPQDNAGGIDYQTDRIIEEPKRQSKLTALTDPRASTPKISTSPFGLRDDNINPDGLASNKDSAYLPFSDMKTHVLERVVPNGPFVDNKLSPIGGYTPVVNTNGFASLKTNQIIDPTSIAYSGGAVFYNDNEPILTKIVKPAKATSGITLSTTPTTVLKSSFVSEETSTTKTTVSSDPGTEDGTPALEYATASPCGSIGLCNQNCDDFCQEVALGTKKCGAGSDDQTNCCCEQCNCGDDNDPVICGQCPDCSLPTPCTCGESDGFWGYNNLCGYVCAGESCPGCHTCVPLVDQGIPCNCPVCKPEDCLSCGDVSGPFGLNICPQGVFCPYSGLGNGCGGVPVTATRPLASCLYDYGCGCQPTPPQGGPEVFLCPEPCPATVCNIELCEIPDCLGECGGVGCDQTIGLCCPTDGSTACVPCEWCPGTTTLELNTTGNTGAEDLTGVKGNFTNKDLLPVAYFRHDLNVGSGEQIVAGNNDTILSSNLILTVKDIYGRLDYIGASPRVKPLKIAVYELNVDIDPDTVSCLQSSAGNPWTTSAGRNTTDRSAEPIGTITLGTNIKPGDKVNLNITSSVRKAATGSGVINFMLEPMEWYAGSTGSDAAVNSRDKVSMLVEFHKNGQNRPKIVTDVLRGRTNSTNRVAAGVARRRAAAGL